MAGSETALFGRFKKGGLFTITSRKEITGSIFWVDNSNANATDSASYGDNPLDTPLATIDYAVGLATASKGDVIFVMPGHAETLAAAITVDKKGLSIIGLGQGDDKPTITFDTTTDEINVTASSVLIKNLRLVSDVNNLAVFIDADESYLTVEDCEFVTSSTKEAYAFIDLATTKDHLVVRGCRVEQPTDPAGTTGGAGTGFVYCVDSEYITLEDCHINGNFETAVVHNKTTKCVELIVKNCVLNQDLADGVLLLLVADVTGAMINTNGRNINATDVTVAKLVGTIGTKFWLDGNSFFGNDSGAGGQLQVVGDAATS